MIRIIFTLATIIAFAFILVTLASDLSSPSPTPDYIGVVDYIIDGDTIIVDSIHIRLLDIDTPELPTPEGVVARSFMIDLVYDSEVSLYCDGYDKYDRWLCIIELDGVNVSDTLLKADLARVWVD